MPLRAGQGPQPVPGQAVAEWHEETPMPFHHTFYYIYFNKFCITLAAYDLIRFVF